MSLLSNSMNSAASSAKPLSKKQKMQLKMKNALAVRKALCTGEEVAVGSYTRQNRKVMVSCNSRFTAKCQLTVEKSLDKGLASSRAARAARRAAAMVEKPDALQFVVQEGKRAPVPLCHSVIELVMSGSEE